MQFKQQFSHYRALTRWNKPIGTLLLLWPTLTALVIAAKGQPIAVVLFVFTAGVFLLRAAGCTLNDLIDKNLDKEVARTKDRPLATGKVGTLEAIALCSILTAVAFVLVLLLNKFTIILANTGVLFIVIYPFLKRITHLPQVGLGIAFSWGIPMAFAAQNNHISFAGYLLFLIAFLWTICYDTMYAMVDRDDDLKVGIKSTAILFGKNDKLIIGTLQAIIILLLTFLGLILQRNFWFYLGIVFCCFTFLYQQFLLKDRDPILCYQAFANNQWSWFLLFFGTYLSYARTMF